MIVSMPPIGRVIAEVRASKGWTQERLAQAAGVTLSTVQKIERGYVIDPGWGTIRRFAGALGVDLNSLAAAEDAPGERPPPEEAPRGRPGKKR